MTDTSPFSIQERLVAIVWLREKGKCGCIASRNVVGRSQSLVHLVSGALSQGLKRPGREVYQSSHPLPRLRMKL
jgi:hypothetical protein